MIEYMVLDSEGNHLRVIRLPDDCDPNDQLQENETYVLYDVRTMGRPYVMVE